MVRTEGGPDWSVVAEVAAAGGGHLTVWVSNPTPATDAAAAEHGLVFGRDLMQLRRPLPLEGPPATVSTRSFVPGQDEEAWLAVNNRAFASHPEQGHWELDEIRRREREPWFDPDGFLLHEEDGKLAAFCWTKIHDNPPMGEIYVIAVDPAYGGRGLGRQLTVAGLDYLAGRGLTVGMLYVDAANTVARGLYADLGFTTHHIDRSYVAQVPPDTPTTAPIP